MSINPIKSLYQDYESIAGFLSENSQPSLLSDASKYFTKVFVLSSASYFEHRIQEILEAFISSKTNNDLRAISFFKKKAITMQYHTYFDWGKKDKPSEIGKNANVFFALFGDDFKKTVEAEIKTTPDLEVAIKAFLELGHLRNILVHSNFAAYDLENKTVEEIFELYKKSLIFINYIEAKLQ